MAMLIAWPAIPAERRVSGRPSSQFDFRIAAIACTHEVGTATSNTVAYEDYEAGLINS
jgi:predicted nucleic acid-binding protein